MGSRTRVDKPNAEATPTPSALAVSDLRWLVESGRLRAGDATGVLDPGTQSSAWPPPVHLSADEQAECREILTGLAAEASAGAVVDDAESAPVGRRVERWVQAWLGRSRRIQLLAGSWPLRVDGRTIGEADVLVERNGGRELWELACKLYLGVPGVGWIGPSLNDRLSTKLRRIRDHQLPLVEHPAFVSQWGADFSARAWIVGWLIGPAQASGLAVSASNGAIWRGADLAMAAQGAGPGPTAGAVDGLRPAAGWLAWDAEAPAAMAYLAQQHLVQTWWLLGRGRWIRPARTADPALAMHPASGPGPRFTVTRPISLAGMACPSPGCWQEVYRLVLVPPGWAGRARALDSTTV